MVHRTAPAPGIEFRMHGEDHQESTCEPHFLTYLETDVFEWFGKEDGGFSKGCKGRMDYQ